jgi:hypothetical protein
MAMSTAEKIATGLIGAVLLLSTGCAPLPDIRLRNPQTGQTFTCSGEAGRSEGRWWDEMAKRTRDGCVRDLEAQGYVVIK